ncbi:MAG: neutral/alkaline non-lysosomal ceramidase N-terminal domain-containing protein [Chitinophagaceae bacterium]|nr:neutral/alkaline non-lysosomal ceramidase N-terminal domain-containing protein [Chitinophagaceae bacterium]
MILYRYIPALLFLFSYKQTVNAQTAQNSNATLFRAAVVKINISPDKPKQLLGYNARLSTGIHDSIYHRIALIDDGKSQFVIVSTEICLISPTEYDRVASSVQKKLKISPANFWWACTHTHSAPEVGPPGFGEVFLGNRYKHPIDTAYSNFIETSIINGIVEARKNLVPARLAKGWGFAQANINRRGIDVNGRASLGLNPEGPVDRRIGLIRLEKADGSPMALLANYPVHGTVLGPPFVEVSGDAPGIVSQYVEQKTGAVVLFINGAAGNLAPIYSVYPTPQSGHLGEFRVLLGDRIIAANEKILTSTDAIKIKSGILNVNIKAKDSLNITKELKQYTSTKENKSIIHLPVRYLKLSDDLVLWSAPIELFCEVSNFIRDQSPFPYTFYYGYTNGWFGYMPTEDAWKNGGYEVDVVNPFSPVAEYELKNAVTSQLQSLKE